MHPAPLVPAQAGTQNPREVVLDSRLRGNERVRFVGPNAERSARRRDFLTLALASVAVHALATPRALAQSRYPDRPIRLVIPFPPGGGYDAAGRPWAEKMKSLLGTVVVENQGGGGSSLGAAAVARARADGYTLLLGGSSTHITEAILKSRPLYDPLKDLDPIRNMVVAAFALAIHPAVPARTLREFIDYAKANPGKLSYGHAGVGSLNHLTGELLKSLAGTPDLVHVPYRGSGPATADALSGQVAMVTPAVTGPLLEFHRTGKLHILAVTSPARLIAAPDIPTAVEAGVPGMISQQSIGLFAPADTPKPIMAQIAQATRTALAEPAYRQTLIESGFEPDLDSSPEKFRRLLEDEIARWTPLVKAIGLKLD
jgi:tripartite-type tricarboxylate transporter receptor subunit TctC